MGKTSKHVQIIKKLRTDKKGTSVLTNNPKPKSLKEIAQYLAF
jgi:hypothetical protein